MNIRSRIAKLGALLVLLVVGACGEPLDADDGADSPVPTSEVTLAQQDLDSSNAEPASAEYLGRCTPETEAILSSGGHWDSPPFVEVLDGHESWLLVQSMSEPDPSMTVGWGDPDSMYYMSAAIVEFTDYEVLQGTGHSTLGMHPFFVADALGELQAGAELAIKVSVDVPSDWPPYASLIFSLRPDGTAAAIGDCGFRYATEPLHHLFGETTGPGESTAAAAFLRDLLSRPEGAAEATRTTSATSQPIVQWEDLPPGLRFLDFDSTPQHVLDTLGVVEIAVNVPQDWIDFSEYGLRICTKTSVGWNGECIMVDIADTGFLSFVVPGEPLEIWLCRADVMITEDQIGLIGLVNPAITGAVIADPHDGDEVAVHIAGDLNSFLLDPAADLKVTAERRTRD